MYAGAASLAAHGRVNGGTPSSAGSRASGLHRARFVIASLQRCWQGRVLSLVAQKAVHYGRSSAAMRHV